MLNRSPEWGEINTQMRFWGQSQPAANACDDATVKSASCTGRPAGPRETLGLAIQARLSADEQSDTKGAA